MCHWLVYKLTASTGRMLVSTPCNAKARCSWTYFFWMPHCWFLLLVMKMLLRQLLLMFASVFGAFALKSYTQLLVLLNIIWRRQWLQLAFNGWTWILLMMHVVELMCRACALTFASVWCPGLVSICRCYGNRMQWLLTEYQCITVVVVATIILFIVIAIRVSGMMRIGWHKAIIVVMTEDWSFTFLSSQWSCVVFVVAIVLELLNEMKAFNEIHSHVEKALYWAVKTRRKREREREREGERGRKSEILLWVM